MFRKYEKTYRIPVPEFNVKGKHFLSKKEIKLLLSGKVDIEEKLDGANTGVVRHKKGFSIQKRGSLVGQSEHEQFNYFHNWARHKGYDELMSLPKGYIVYTELMYLVHSMYYDKLPDYVIIIDVWNGQRYLTRQDKENFCEKYGLHCVPLITSGIFGVSDLYSLIPKKSVYGDEIEGIVVKKYRKKKQQLRGKVVLSEFIRKIDADGKHWTRKKQVKNELA